MTKTLKVLLAVGTRPEVIKMSPVIRTLSQHPDCISSKICVTSQHREMAEQALQVFKIRPDYDLDVMTRDQSPSQVAAAVLERIEPVLKSERPDWLLVQGDTTSVMAASLSFTFRSLRNASFPRNSICRLVCRVRTVRTGPGGVPNFES